MVGFGWHFVTSYIDVWLCLLIMPGYMLSNSMEEILWNFWNFGAKAPTDAWRTCTYNENILCINWVVAASNVRGIRDFGRTRWSHNIKRQFINNHHLLTLQCISSNLLPEHIDELFIANWCDSRHKNQI